METQKINFIDNFVAKRGIVNNNLNATKPPEYKNDSFENKGMSKEKKIILASMLAIILAAVVIKRKSITNFIKKIFNKGGDDISGGGKIGSDVVNGGGSSGAGAGAAGKISNILDDFDIPKPKFTVGPENAEKFAQEKAEYIKSIWMSHIKYYPHLNEIPKDKRVAGLKALQEYGTRDDLLRLNRENNDCITSKDSEIFIEYVKFVRKVGSTSGKIDEYDYSPVRSVVDRKITEIYNEETIEEILKTLKHFMIDNTIPGKFKNASWEEYKRFKILSEHPNKVIAEHARLLMARLKTDNPWM